MTSQHLNTHKIITILNDEGEYMLTHETLRAMILWPIHPLRAEYILLHEPV